MPPATWAVTSKVTFVAPGVTADGPTDMMWSNDTFFRCRPSA
ncbi:hypothetical protein ACQ4WX_46620 [Streptomyces lasalocidi]